MDQQAWDRLNRKLIEAEMNQSPQKTLQRFRKFRFLELQHFIHADTQNAYNRKYLNQILQIIPIYEAEIFKLFRLSRGHSPKRLQRELHSFVYNAILYDKRSQAIQQYRHNQYGLNDH